MINQWQLNLIQHGDLMFSLIVGSLLGFFGFLQNLDIMTKLDIIVGLNLAMATLILSCVLVAVFIITIMGIIKLSRIIFNI